MINKMKSLDVLSIVCLVFLVVFMFVSKDTTPVYLFVVEMLLLAIMLLAIVLNLKLKNKMQRNTVSVIKSISVEDFDNIKDLLEENYGGEISEEIETLLEELVNIYASMKHVTDLAKYIEKDEVSKFKLREIELDSQLRHALRVFIKQKETLDSSQMINTEFLKRIKSNKFADISIDSDNVTEQQLNAILKSFETIDKNLKNTQPAFYEGDFNVEMEAVDVERDYLNITSKLGTLLTSQKKSIINLYYAILMLEEFDHQEIISSSYKGNLVHNFRALETVYENLTVSIENIAYAIEHKANIGYDHVSEIFRPIIDTINKDETFKNALPEKIEDVGNDKLLIIESEFGEKILNSKSNFESKHFTKNHELILDIENRLKDMQVVFDEDLKEEIQEEIQEVKEEIQEVKEEIQEVKEEIQEVKEEIQEIKEEIKEEVDYETNQEIIQEAIENLNENSNENANIDSNADSDEEIKKSANEEIIESNEVVNHTLEENITLENSEMQSSEEELDESLEIEESEINLFEESNEEFDLDLNTDSKGEDENLENSVEVLTENIDEESTIADELTSESENVENVPKGKEQNVVKFVDNSKAEQPINNLVKFEAKQDNKRDDNFVNRFTEKQNALNSSKQQNNTTKTNTTNNIKNDLKLDYAKQNSQTKLNSTSNRLNENKGGKRVSSINGNKNNAKKPLTYQDAVKSGELDRVKPVEYDRVKTDNGVRKKIEPIKNNRGEKEPITYQQFLKDKEGTGRTTEVRKPSTAQETARKSVETKPRQTRFATKENPTKDFDSNKKRSKLVENLGRELSQRERAELDLYGEILDDKTRSKMDLITSGTDLAGF